MIIEEFDQLKIQSHCGIYNRYPVAVIISRILQTFKITSVLDITYGKGRFYKIYRPGKLIASDPIKREWFVKPDFFFNVNCFKLYEILKDMKINVDCIVVDPPKWNDYNFNKFSRPEFNYIEGTCEQIIYYGYKIAKLINAAYILVHSNKIVKFIDYGPVYLAKFYWRTRYANAGNKYSLFILYKYDGRRQRAIKKI
jgi:hypothetical protein